MKIGSRERSRTRKRGRTVRAIHRDAVVARALSTTIFALAKFANSLWLATEGNPSDKAFGEDFETAVRLEIDVLRALPKVLRRHPFLVDFRPSGSAPGFAIVDSERCILQDKWTKGDALWVTRDGVTLGRHVRVVHDVLLTKRRPRTDDVRDGFGCVDRKRDLWPSLPVCRELLEKFESQRACYALLDRRAARMVSKALDTIAETQGRTLTRGHERGAA